MSTSAAVEGTERPSDLFAQLADMKLCIKGKWLYLHSSQLADRSKVLCSLFASTPRETWSEGLKTAIDEFDIRDIVMYSELHRDGSSVGSVRNNVSSKSNLCGLISLAHKLDSHSILEACETFLIQNPWMWESDMVGWRAFASRHDLPRLHTIVGKAIIGRLLDKSKPKLENLGTEDSLNDLGAAEYKFLFEGILGAWNEARNLMVNNDYRLDQAAGIVSGYQ